MTLPEGAENALTFWGLIALFVGVGYTIHCCVGFFQRRNLYKREARYVAGLQIKKFQTPGYSAVEAMINDKN